MKNKEKSPSLVLRGMKDGIPIGLGYFAVSFSLGITAHNAGITAIQGFVMSLLNNASAGEYAGIAAIKANAPYLEIALLILIANARYLLMSCVLSQRLAPELPLRHRLLLGFDLTDEIFGLSIASPAPLVPKYIYGAYITTIPCWAIGTALGIIAGNILPVLAVKSLSAAIYGMFIAIIIPPCKKNKAVLVVIFASFALSGICAILPIISNLSESLRIIILTVLISVAAAIVHPVNTDKEELSQ
ncbi:MAG: AzlC family ABC transporter permease [Acutalibacteraceae bacterium]